MYKRQIKDGTTRTAALISGDVDFIERVAPSDLPTLEKRDNIKVFKSVSNRLLYLTLHMTDNPIKPYVTDKNGIIFEDGKKIRVDILVFATGFDAMTGSLQKLGLIGKNGIRLEDFWRSGPQTYLGLAIPNFPNLFTITGPGSPSVLTNMPRSIEQHVDWITQLLKYLTNSNMTKVEAKEIDAENWTKSVSYTHLTLPTKA